MTAARSPDLPVPCPGNIPYPWIRKPELIAVIRELPEKSMPIRGHSDNRSESAAVITSVRSCLQHVFFPFIRAWEMVQLFIEEEKR